MGCKHNLHVRIEFKNHFYELLLPIDMKTNLRFVHEKHIMLSVLNEHGEQYGEHLLLATRQLVGSKPLSHLRKKYFVACADKLLASFRKQFVQQVLELLLRSGYLLRLNSAVSITILQHLDDAVADVHLIVKVFALQLIQLPVQFGGYGSVNDAVHGVTAHERTVKAADYVVAYPPCILRTHLYVYALEHVARKLAALRQSSHHLIQYGALPHSIDTAEYIHLGVKVPLDMFGVAPKRLYLYLYYVVGILLHRLLLWISKFVDKHYGNLNFLFSYKKPVSCKDSVNLRQKKIAL